MSRSIRSTPIAEEVACPACGRRTQLTVLSMIARTWFCERCREYRRLHAAADELSAATGDAEGAAARYRRLLAERTLARSLAPGGELDQDQELRFAESLDLAWDEMSAEEREEAERRFAAATSEGAPL